MNDKGRAFSQTPDSGAETACRRALVEVSEVLSNKASMVEEI
jgi:hypothetical protein